MSVGIFKFALIIFTVNPIALKREKPKFKQGKVSDNWLENLYGNSIQAVCLTCNQSNPVPTNSPDYDQGSAFSVLFFCLS